MFIRVALAVLFTAGSNPGDALAQPVPANAVPVTAVLSKRRDVEIVERTIGTVQAFQSVVMRARVDGTLDQVLFTEGQTVKPGDLIAQLDARPYRAILEQAVAKRASDYAMLTNARSDLVRYTDLAQSQVASKQRLDLQRANVAQAEASVHGGDAAISAALTNLSFTRIVSPIEGRVGLRGIDPGNFIRAADPNSPGIVTIAQIHPIALVFTLPQDALPTVQAAMRKNSLPVTAYSSDDKIKLSEGELLAIDSAIDTSTGTIRMKASFSNTDDNLWPGQFVNVRLRLGTLHDALTVPNTAIQRGPAGLFVYVVRPGALVAVQPIEIGQDDGRFSVVTAGLVADEQVVIAGQSRLINGAHVTITEGAAIASGPVL